MRWNESRGRSHRRDSRSHTRRRSRHRSSRSPIRERSRRRDSRSPIRSRRDLRDTTPEPSTGRKRVPTDMLAPPAFRPRLQTQDPVRHQPQLLDVRSHGSSGGVRSEEPGFSDSNSAKGFDRIRKRIVGNLSTPFFGGPSPGPLTEPNCAVFLEEKLRSSFRTLESGVVRLEPDEMVNGVWTTMPDQYTPRRVELLSEFVHDHLATRDAMNSDEPVEVWSITGEVQRKQKEDVTGTDWLRLLVREQALTSISKELALAALDAVSRQPNEAFAAAAARVVKTFRASFANPDRPCVSETQFFWRFVTESDMRILFNHLTDVLMPNPFERNGVSGLLLDHTQRISESLRKLRLEWHDPCSQVMVARGVETHRLYKTFAEILSARSVSCCTPSAPKRGSKKVGGDNMFSLTELSEAFASKESLAAFVGANHARGTPLANAHSLSAMYTGHSTNPVLPEPALESTLPCVAAFQNQVASTPGQHGVPFESSTRSASTVQQQQQQQQQQQPLPVYPPADARQHRQLPADEQPVLRARFLWEVQPRQLPLQARRRTTRLLHGRLQGEAWRSSETCRGVTVGGPVRVRCTARACRRLSSG